MNAKGFRDFVIFAMTLLALAGFVLLCGCASLRADVGEVDTGAVLKAAAAGASGDYGKAISEIAKAVEKRTGKTPAPDPLAGFSFTRTYFYDGMPVADPAKITWEDRWTKTGAAGKSDVPVASSTSTASAADAALREDIAAILKAAGVAEE